MLQLQQVKEENILFYDIETAAIYKKLPEEGPVRDAWAYKMRYQNADLNKKGDNLPSTLEDLFESKAALYSTFARVVCISIGRITKGQLSIRSYSDEDEFTLLNNFNEDLKQVVAANPNLVMGGFNINVFDNPFLEKRLYINGIKPCPIICESHLKPWEVKSVDIAKIWKGNALYLDSLQSVAVALGLPSPKQSVDGSEVSEYFYSGKLKEIEVYCEGDVHCCVRIFKRLRFEDDIPTYKSKNDKIKKATLLERINASTELSPDDIKEIQSRIDTVEDIDAFRALVASVYIKPSDKKKQKQDKENFLLNLIRND